MLVSDKIKEERLKICNGCEFKRNNFKIFNIILLKREAQCKICKCMINKKVNFEFAKCPKDKWVK